MIQHFRNIQTPLRSIHKYPRLIDQQRRFENAGWPSATVRSLWDIWSDHSIVSPQQKLDLDAVEPFDEWEEFVLFASHYFILVATKTSCERSALLRRCETLQADDSLDLGAPVTRDTLNVYSYPVPIANARRFGAVLPVSQQVFGHYGGLGSQTRSDNLDFYGPAGQHTPDAFSVGGIEPRMCHSISPAGQNAFLLVGGRASPTKAFKDCWILCQHSYRVDDLPVGLYRHSAAQVNIVLAGQNNPGVIIYGGKTGENQTSNKWMLWRETVGWIQLDTTDSSLKPRFGAVIESTNPGTGLLIGGMDACGKILAEVWEWSILERGEGLSIAIQHVYVSMKPSIPSNSRETSSPLKDPNLPSLNPGIVGRMGACLINSPLGLLLIGGVLGKTSTQNIDILRLTKACTNENGPWGWQISLLDYQTDGKWPLLVGHTALSFHGSVVIAGGGAVCFSFGTYWNQAITTVHTGAEQQVQFTLLAPDSKLPSARSMREQKSLTIPDPFAGKFPRVQNEKIISAREFEGIAQEGHPVIIQGSQLGSCTTSWTMDNLKAKIGADRNVSFELEIVILKIKNLQVVIHESTSPHLNFSQKNFSYIKKPFKDFVDEVNKGSRQYLRSIASDSPSQKPADFWTDFPELSSDFGLPSEFDMVKENTHSCKCFPTQAARFYSEP